MALVSIKRALAKSEEEAAYRRVISMLLDGVATHALNLDREACRNFRERIGTIREAIVSGTTVEALLVNGVTAVQSIGDYARETTRLVRAQDAEMQDMIAMLARTVVEIGGTGGRAVARLRKIGDDLDHAAAVENVLSLKARLRECLEAIRAEAKQQEAELGQMVRALRNEISRKQGLDPITELDGEIAAQAQFLSALRAGEQRLVAVFVLTSARNINLRFGRAACDEALCELKRYLAGQLQSGDRMYRWAGPAIVALLTGADPFEQVHARLKRFLEKPIERAFDVNGNSVAISLSIAWSVFPLSPPLAELNRQIHDFIGGQGYRDESSTLA